MATFEQRFARLDRRVFSRLGDGLATIDGKEIEAIYNKQTVQFDDSRVAERSLEFSESVANELGIKPNRSSLILWQGREERLAIPPLYQDGVIRLVLA
ncbi:TPA: hypothetical protein AB5E57_001647 [Vibrio cholerae]|uniref:hypothetical protein n=1 Tax=Vibrio TaxID=662 RepID=UPI0001BADE0E|nr:MULTISPECIES: hypothetical protein [Vibrio]EEY36210.1 hypothetical protein VII_003753 [Vibrio mimicus MB451]MDV2340903.1 hypothetical protein [Vibrio cholerae]RGP86590.1 hypothetical protein BC354_13415 [Vibrio cholerae]RGP94354.1 hypothetical protein BC352_13070 [Vibrio cholerae]TQP68445.1 hypothetical protein FLL76_00435 [Vibrio cholerae]